MKKIFFLSTFLVMAAFSSTEASAWYCKATSPTGSSGWGRSSNRAQAARIAVQECAIRTTRRSYCSLRYCS